MIDRQEGDDGLTAAEAIALKVVDLDPGARESAIESFCENDAGLAEAVRALVMEITETDSWFRHMASRSGVLFEGASERTPVKGEDGTSLAGDAFAAPLLPQSVGPFRVVEMLGRGGMGVVYLAEREDRDFRMRVAVKVLHPYLASAPFRQRFASERQILARLSHPGIARLIDGGVLDDGTPYLVMELVEGTDLVAWADARSLNTNARVRLFLQVCRAVGYAHRNLVVHRDLKPSNTKVTADGQVKLLDFGIARVLDTGAESEITRLHPYSGAPLTPAFASPEQRRGDPIGTPSDVYSMGLLLCRLLGRETGPSGSTPSVPDGLPEDLTAVIRRALRDDPEGRYGSAEELGDDLTRYLEARPVRARQGSRRYHLRKFVHRNRWAVVATGVVFLAILAGAAGLAAHTVRLGVERDRVAFEAERAEAVTGFLLDLFDVAGEGTALDTIRAGTLLRLGEERLRERLDQQPAVQIALLDALAQANLRLGVPFAPERLWAERIDSMVDLHGPDHIEVAGARKDLGLYLSEARHWRQSLQELEESLRIQRAKSGEGQMQPEDRKSMAVTLSGMVAPLRHLDMPDSAVVVARAALELDQEGAVGDGDFLNTLAQLAFALRGTGDLDGAEELYLRVLNASPLEWNSSTILNNLGSLMRAKGDLAASERWFREGVEVARAKFGPDTNQTETLLANLVDVLAHQGRYDEASALAAEWEVELLRTHPPDHWRAGRARLGRGLVWIDSGDCGAGLDFLEEGAAIYTAALGEDNSTTAGAYLPIAQCLVNLGRSDDARPLLEAALPRLLAAPNPNGSWIELGADLLAGIHVAEGRHAEAEQVRRRYGISEASDVRGSQGG